MLCINYLKPDLLPLGWGTGPKFFINIDLVILNVPYVFFQLFSSLADLFFQYRHNLASAVGHALHTVLILDEDRHYWLAHIEELFQGIRKFPRAFDSPAFQYHLKEKKCSR